MTIVVPSRTSPELVEILAQLDKLVAGKRDLRGDTRERILDVAIQSFAREGFTGTSVRKLSGPLGITPAGLYSHFASKEEIMGAALARSYRRFLEYVFLSEGGKPDTELNILSLLRRHMEFQLRFRDTSSATDQLLALFTAEAYIEAQTLALIRQAQRLYFNRVRNAIAQERGASALDVSLEAEAVLSLCDSVSAGPRVKPEREPEELIDSYLVIIRRMLTLNP